MIEMNTSCLHIFVYLSSPVFSSLASILYLIFFLQMINSLCYSQKMDLLALINFELVWSPFFFLSFFRLFFFSFCYVCFNYTDFFGACSLYFVVVVADVVATSMSVKCFVRVRFEIFHCHQCWSHPAAHQQSFLSFSLAQKTHTFW